VATTSSNKMPLLVDRPLHSFATVGGAACLNTATNFNTVNGGGCALLVDCSSNDGGVIDSISIIANEASTTASTVLVLLSVATSSNGINSSNTACIASAAIGSSTAGQRTNISLPPLSIPVPGSTGTNELDKKNTGIYVPSGALIYVGVNAVLTAPSAATRVHVFAQGGFF
jgi:hypothetical protein